MDNNQGIQQPAAESKKTIIWLMVGLVAVILLVGVIYWYLGRQQAAETPPTPKPPTTESNLEQGLNQIDVESADSDFTSLDVDLENL